MKIILSVFFTFSVLLCFGQNNFLPGYIVTSTGDTINGNINYMNWRQNPRTIKFRENGKEISLLGLNDLVAFEITGQDKYEKYIVIKSGRPQDYTQINEPIPDKILSDTVFLRVLVKGQASLYELVDKRTYYFIGIDDGEPHELEHWLEPQTQSGDFYTRNTYQTQLLQFASKLTANKDINDQIINSRYTEKSLVNIINQINLLNGGTANSVKLEKKNAAYFFVGSGVNIGEMNFGGTSPEFSTLNYSTSVTPSFRAGADFASIRNMQRLILRTELTYNTLKFTGTATVDEGSVFERNVNYNLQLNMISPAMNVLYVIVQGRMDIYLGLGFSWNITNSTNSHVSIYKNGQQQRVIDPFREVQTGWVGVNGKAGMMINKKFDVNINYNFAGSFVQYSSYSAGANVLGLELNYRFRGSKLKKQ